MPNNHNFKKRIKQQADGHREHPVRNFFYVLYSVVNIVAFLGFFCALYVDGMTARIPILIATGALLAVALFTGVVRPLMRRKH